MHAIYTDYEQMDHVAILNVHFGKTKERDKFSVEKDQKLQGNESSVGNLCIWL